MTRDTITRAARETITRASRLLVPGAARPDRDALLRAVVDLCRVGRELLALVEAEWERSEDQGHDALARLATIHPDTAAQVRRALTGSDYAAVLAADRLLRTGGLLPDWVAADRDILLRALAARAERLAVTR